MQFGLESLFAPDFKAATAPLYALLSGSVKEVLEQAEEAATQGYAIVKLKVSALPFKIAQDLIRRLQKQFRLRIDCNSAFSLKEALCLFAPYDITSFDYIEDPTYEINSLKEFTHPFALDEAVAQFPSLGLEDCPNFYGFVLKPTLLGGKEGRVPYVDFARRHRLKVVFSPAFESGLGLLQILQLAQAFGVKVP